MDANVRPATAADREAIAVLLRAADLPVADLASAPVSFLVVDDARGLAGVARGA